MGAEGVRDLLEQVDLEAEAELLEETINTSKGQKQARAVKRLKVADAFLKSQNKPEWMVLDVVPVIPRSSARWSSSTAASRPPT